MLSVLGASQLTGFVVIMVMGTRQNTIRQNTVGWQRAAGLGQLAASPDLLSLTS